jgi:hypothetical protein
VSQLTARPDWVGYFTAVGAEDLTMQWHSQHPGVVNALHLFLLAVLLLMPVVISQLLSSALE